MWNAINGQVFARDTISRTSTSTTVALNFEPYESHVIVFSKRTGLPATTGPGETSATIDLETDWHVSFGAGPPSVMTTCTPGPTTTPRDIFQEPQPIASLSISQIAFSRAAKPFSLILAKALRCPSRRLPTACKPGMIRRSERPLLSM